MAVASQKITLTRFLERIRGALTAAPTKLEPVNQIPHAAPTTENPNPIAMPQFAHESGDKWEMTSFHPSKSNYNWRTKRLARGNYLPALQYFVVQSNWARAAAAARGKPVLLIERFLWVQMNCCSSVILDGINPICLWSFVNFWPGFEELGLACISNFRVVLLI